MNIAVTGLGIICAIGNNPTGVLDSLRQGHTGIGRMKYLQSSHKELPVGEVKLSNDELKGLLGIPREKLYSRTTLLGSIAVTQALSSAGLSVEALKGKRVILLSGTTVGGMDITELMFKRMQDDDSILPYINRHDCGSCTQEIAEICNIECEVITISTACSSAINSIIVGSEMIRAGEADIVIAGGSEALSKFHLNGFNALHILDTENCRPFDKTRVGLNLGEGAAFIVLQKDVEDAKAYISGYGNKCDAFHQTASSENGEGAFLAMQEAIEMSGIEPSDIDYINAHGTGTPNNDPSESAALKRIFGYNIPVVSSTKGLTGHTTSASGSIETVISILAMQNDFIPVNYGFKEPDETCIKPFTGDEKKHSINYTLCNTFGFGGNDSSLLLSKRPSQITTYKNDNDVEIVADVIIATPDQLEKDKDLISSRERRRMGDLLKAATITSIKALKEAGIDLPDAIISATANGMLETSEKYLIDMIENGEDALSPTLFMQSTHNTVGSNIAIRLKCHGYNITYSQGRNSLKCALDDARRLIKTGKAHTVLVGVHDEATPLFQDFYQRLGQPVPPTIYSRSIVLHTK